jgi:trigger factor
VVKAISDANKQNNITIMDVQQVHPEKLDKDGIVMQAVVYLKPIVEELDYTNLKATKLPNEASTEEVEAQINQFREQAALLAPVTDRPVQFGDMVVISYVGSQADKAGKLIPFQGGTATRQQLTLLESSFIPGFGEQIVGMTPDQTKTFTVTFPEKYHAANLAGKQATFELTLHEIKVKNLPDVDNDFAATYSASSVEELKQNIAKSISEKKAQFNQSKTETEVCLELVKRAKISPIPQSMIQRRLETLLQQESGAVGLGPDAYLQQRKLTRDSFERAYYSVAIRDLKVQLILDHIATAGNFTVSDEEREEYCKSQSTRSGYTVQQIKEMIPSDQLDSQVRVRKAYDYLLGKVEFV